MLHLALNQALSLKFCRVRNVEKNTVLPSDFQKAKSVVHLSREVFEASDQSTQLQIRAQITRDCLAHLSVFSKIWIAFVCSQFLLGSSVPRWQR